MPPNTIIREPKYMYVLTVPVRYWPSFRRGDGEELAEPATDWPSFTRETLESSRRHVEAWVRKTRNQQFMEKCDECA
jgi:hypothetical protein